MTNAITSKSVVNACYKKFWFLQQLEEDKYLELRDNEDFKKLYEQQKRQEE